MKRRALLAMGMLITAFGSGLGVADPAAPAVAPPAQKDVVVYPFCSIATGKKLDPKTKGIFDELRVNVTSGKEFRIRLSGKKREESGNLNGTPVLHAGKMFLLPIADRKGILEVALPTTDDVRFYHLTMEMADGSIKTKFLDLKKNDYEWKISKEGEQIVYKVMLDHQEVASMTGPADKVKGFGLASTVRWKGSEANIAMTVE